MQWAWLRTEPHSGGYRYAVIPDHPNADAKGRVLEHRAVMENTIGRLLATDEVVHHLNEVKDDNRVENLQIMLAGDHTREHHKRQSVVYICPTCTANVVRQPRNVNGARVFCSRLCAARAPRTPRRATQRPLPEHGSRARYLKKCRCELCRSANTAYTRHRRASGL